MSLICGILQYFLFFYFLHFQVRSMSGWSPAVDSSWNVVAHRDAREGKWRGNWRMEWVASTLHTTSEHGISSITTADTHTSDASSRLNWRPSRFKWTRFFSPKDEIWFLRVCHHISAGLYSLSTECRLGYRLLWLRFYLIFPIDVRIICK